MPPVNAADLVHLVNTSGGNYTNGLPVAQSNFVGVAIKNQGVPTSEGFATQTIIADDEQFILIWKGEVQVATPIGNPAEGAATWINSNTGDIHAEAGSDEVQVITLTDADGGTFTLTYDTEETDPIAYDATGAEIQTALLALTNLDTGDVVVTGPAGGPWTVTFGGTLADVDVDEIVIDDALLLTTGGTGAIETTVPGDDDPATNEEQVITITADGGTFTLTYDGETTAPLDFDAAAATVQTALRALPSIDGAHVDVTGAAGGPYTVEFVGDLAATDVDEITVDDAGLLELGGSGGVATTDAGGDLYLPFGRVSAVAPNEGLSPGKVLIDLDDKSAVAGDTF